MPSPGRSEAEHQAAQGFWGGNNYSLKHFQRSYIQEHAGKISSTIRYPSVLLELGILESNISEMSLLAAECGVKLRPHVKIHESQLIAKMQIETGAAGIEIGSIDRAEPMADAGIEDILIAHPFYSAEKFNTLKVS